MKTTEDTSIFTARDWYVSKPSEKDELFHTTLEVLGLVEECQRVLKENENKSITSKGAGPSTQYLLMIPDEQWSKPTIDQALALYLIEVADLSKTRQRSANFYKNVICLV